MNDDNFSERFLEFAEEAKAIKVEAMARIMPLLAQADTIVDELRQKGLGCRISLPMGVNVKFAHAQIDASLQVNLK